MPFGRAGAASALTRLLACSSRSPSAPQEEVHAIARSHATGRPIAAGTPLSIESLNRASQIAWTQLAAATVANIALTSDKN